MKTRELNSETFGTSNRKAAVIHYTAEESEDEDKQRAISRISTILSSGWWFQIFFIFIPIWGRFPF